MNVLATIKTKEVNSHYHGHFITTVSNIKNEKKRIFGKIVTKEWSFRLNLQIQSSLFIFYMQYT